LKKIRQAHEAELKKKRDEKEERDLRCVYGVCVRACMCVHIYVPVNCLIEGSNKFIIPLHITQDYNRYNTTLILRELPACAFNSAIKLVLSFFLRIMSLC